VGRGCTMIADANIRRLFFRLGFAAIVAANVVVAAASQVATPTEGNTWYVGTDGWTVFKGSRGVGTCSNASSNYSGTCVVYVANSGDDRTCAAQPLPVTPNPAHPCATPAKAQTLLRDHSPDWMLLKKGDWWAGGVNGTNGAWSKNGKSAAEPMLISSYGSGRRPIFTTHGVDTACYSTTGPRGQYMAIVGIECYVDYADPDAPSYLGVTATGDISSSSPIIANMTSTQGIAPGYVAFGSGINELVVQSVGEHSVILNGNPAFTSTKRSIQFNKRFTSGAMFLHGVINFLILEDCKLRFGGIAIINNPPAPVGGLMLRIRRNLILDPYGTIGHGGNGVFLGDNQSPKGSILFEENVVDHAGYNTKIWGAGGNVFSQNFYLHDDNPPISFIRNISMNASATGAQVRNGGNVYDNLLIRNPIGFVSNPGVQFNATTYSFNVLTEASDIIVGIRSATGATAPGSSTVELDGVLTSGNYDFVGKGLADLDNPGAISSSISAVTATTATTAVNVNAGKRGDGVKPGDRLAIYMSRGQGIVVGPTGTFSPVANIGGTLYPPGSKQFYFMPAHPLPNWVVPGMNIAVYQRMAFPGGQTKVESISDDRLTLTTVDASTIAIKGDVQNVFVIWTSGDYSHFPPVRIGPNNIFTTSAVLGGTSYAYSQQSFSQNIRGDGNYYYNWNTVAARNFEELGIPGTNINGPNPLNVAGSNAYPNATIAAYDASIGGPGTVDHFIAQVRLQSKDHWDERYTARAANNYIRNALGCNCPQ
jgi:hypothetical protein